MAPVLKRHLPPHRRSAGFRPADGCNGDCEQPPTGERRSPRPGRHSKTGATAVGRSPKQQRGKKSALRQAHAPQTAKHNTGQRDAGNTKPTPHQPRRRLRQLQSVAGVALVLTYERTLPGRDRQHSCSDHDGECPSRRGAMRYPTVCVLTRRYRQRDHRGKARRAGLQVQEETVPYTPGWAASTRGNSTIRTGPG